MTKRFTEASDASGLASRAQVVRAIELDGRIGSGDLVQFTIIEFNPNREWLASLAVRGTLN